MATMALFWRRWAQAAPPPDAAPCPFGPSAELSHVEYIDTVSIPVGGDTWYVSQINLTHLFASWTDGGLCSQGGADKGLCYRAAGFPTPAEANAERHGTTATMPWCAAPPFPKPPPACKQMPWQAQRTGYGIVPFSSTKGGLQPTLTLANLGTVQANSVPYEGRYPSRILSYKGLLLYGTYALAVPANSGDAQNNVSAGGCGNWCAQGPWWGFRHCVDGGRTIVEPRVTGKNPSDTIFGEQLLQTGDKRQYPFGSDTWLGHVKFGAAQVVDMGVDLEHSSDGKLYIIGHGSTADGAYSASAWMHNGAPSWSQGDVASAKPLFVWQNRTGVATMSYLAALKKWVMVVRTPQHCNSIIGSFDTQAYSLSYFLEADYLTGPLQLVSYWQAFGPQAYFVGLPTAFAPPKLSTDGEKALELSLSYSATFHPAEPPNPPGRTGGWNIRKARIVLKHDDAPRKWKVLNNTDWPHDDPDPQPYHKAYSASACADLCLLKPNCVAVSWNAPPSDSVCNFKCGSNEQRTSHGEQGVIVRSGKNFCSQPAPPPTPPTPETLCPADTPSDWLAACKAADLFFESPHGPQQAAKLLPEVGNGFVAWKVKSSTVFAAGVFNGPAGELSESDGNGRARIPPFLTTLSFPKSATSLGQALNVREAVFLQRSLLASNVRVEQTFFAPMQAPNIIALEIVLDGSAMNVSSATAMLTGAVAGGSSADLSLTPFETHHAEIVGRFGTNKQTELPRTAKTLVATAANVLPASVTVAKGQIVKLFALQSFATSLNSSDVQVDAVSSLLSAMAAAKSGDLHKTHTSLWSARADQAGLEAEGDLWLAQSLNASLYFIRASIRADFAHGLSPGGLASDGYGGHSFWDQETWMWPPLLMLDPTCAKSALRYRYDRTEGAHNKSNSCGQGKLVPCPGSHCVGAGSGCETCSTTAYCPPGYKPSSLGLQFPWESALTGTEVQLTKGLCGPWCMYEQHVSGDIAFACRQYYYATGDMAWLRKIGWPLVRGVASFYSRRIESNGTGGFSFNQVMGPDEFAYPVNNSAYTNTVAKLALQFATEAAAVLGEVADPLWAKIAAGLFPPFSSSVPGHPELTGGYHPEYDVFPAETVKQADTIMMSFPFGAAEDPRTLANDLIVYTDITDQNGPAMTWAIFAINWMEVALQSGNAFANNFTNAVHYFNRGYANVQRPFNVWRETPSGGAVNFITGAGGFLQSALFGSSGMRLTKAGLTFNPPPTTASGGAATAMTARFHYRGNRVKRRVHGDSVTTTLLEAGEGAAALQLTEVASGMVHALKVSVALTLPRAKATITAV